eukprot:1722299-Prymnesium_polylepis.1
MHIHDAAATLQQQKRGSCAKVSIRELLQLLLVFPAYMFVLCLIFGGVIALLEDWDWRMGWQYTLSITGGLASPLGAAVNASPTSTLARLAAGVCGIFTVSFTGLIAAWASKLQLVWLYTRRLALLFNAHPADRPIRSLVAFLFHAVVVVPCVVTVYIIAFGCVLSVVENWGWDD